MSRAAHAAESDVGSGRTHAHAHAAGRRRGGSPKPTSSCIALSKDRAVWYAHFVSRQSLLVTTMCSDFESKGIFDFFNATLVRIVLAPEATGVCHEPQPRSQPEPLSWNASKHPHAQADARNQGMYCVYCVSRIFHRCYCSRKISDSVPEPHASCSCVFVRAHPVCRNSSSNLPNTKHAGCGWPGCRCGSSTDYHVGAPMACRPTAMASSPLARCRPGVNSADTDPDTRKAHPSAPGSARGVGLLQDFIGWRLRCAPHRAPWAWNASVDAEQGLRLEQDKGTPTESGNNELNA